MNELRTRRVMDSPVRTTEIVKIVTEESIFSCHHRSVLQMTSLSLDSSIGFRESLYCCHLGATGPAAERPEQGV